MDFASFKNEGKPYPHGEDDGSRNMVNTGSIGDKYDSSFKKAGKTHVGPMNNIKADIVNINATYVDPKVKKHPGKTGRGLLIAGSILLISAIGFSLIYFFIFHHEDNGIQSGNYSTSQRPTSTRVPLDKTTSFYPGGDVTEISKVTEGFEIKKISEVPQEKDSFLGTVTRSNGKWTPTSPRVTRTTPGNVSNKQKTAGPYHPDIEPEEPYCPHIESEEPPAPAEKTTKMMKPLCPGITTTAEPVEPSAQDWLVPYDKWNGAKPSYWRCAQRSSDIIKVNNLKIRSCHSQEECIKVIKDETIDSNFLIGNDALVYENTGWNCLSNERLLYDYVYDRNRTIKISFIGDYTKNRLGIMDKHLFHLLIQDGIKRGNILEKNYEIYRTCEGADPEIISFLKKESHYHPELCKK